MEGDASLGTTDRAVKKRYFELLDANLEHFDAGQAQVLEYWLDVSAFAGWRKPVTRALDWARRPAFALDEALPVAWHPAVHHLCLLCRRRLCERVWRASTRGVCFGAVMSEAFPRRGCVPSRFPAGNARSAERFISGRIRPTPAGIRFVPWQ